MKDELKALSDEILDEVLAEGVDHLAPAQWDWKNGHVSYDGGKTWLVAGTGEEVMKSKLKPVFVRTDNNKEVKVGVAFIDTDGTMTINLDCLPVNGKLIIKELDK